METNNDKQKITPFLWFDDRAEEAMELYTSIFPNSKINFLNRWPKGSDYPEGTVQTGSFTLDGCTFFAFDAGPMFTFNTSISFFAVMETQEGVDALWEELGKDGEVLMPLDNYPWSPRYGWVSDRFGLSWQLMLGEIETVGQRISPCLMFSGDQRGKAEEALRKHRSLFGDTTEPGISRYGAGEAGPEGLVNHAQYTLAGQTFMAMDNAMDFEAAFNEAISLYVTCRDQREVDYFWEGLTKDGGAESQCGWLRDPYGISWQIIPEFLNDKIAQGDPKRLGQMMQALYGMKKLDVAQLKAAYER